MSELLLLALAENPGWEFQAFVDHAGTAYPGLVLRLYRAGDVVRPDCGQEIHLSLRGPHSTDRILLSLLRGCGLTPKPGGEYERAFRKLDGQYPMREAGAVQLG